MGLNTMVGPRRSYVPAAGHDWTLPLYDPLVKLLGGDRTRTVLVDHAAIRPGHRVLEIGCGTGTLTLVIKRLHPAVDVLGLDPDPKALARARRKAERAAVCSTTSRDMKRRRRSVRSGACSNPAASFTSLISQARRPRRMVSWPAGFTPT